MRGPLLVRDTTEIHGQRETLHPTKRHDAVTRDLQIDSHHLQPDPSALEGGQIPPQTVPIAAAGVPDGQPACV